MQGVNSSARLIPEALVCACRFGPGSFTVAHFAGSVTYDTYGLISKNRDVLPDGLTTALAGSQCGVLNQVFSDAAVADLEAVPAPGRRRTSRRLISVRAGRSKRVKKAGAQTNRRKRKRQLAMTVAAQFHASLNELLARMGLSEPHFLRCIKPNSTALPSSFAPDYVMQQLRYAGVLETVRIRREGFSARMAFDDFLGRFGVLAFPYTQPPAARGSNCVRVLNLAQVTGFMVGRSKIFLKYWAVDLLSQQVNELAAVAIRIQTRVRHFPAQFPPFGPF